MFERKNLVFKNATVITPTQVINNATVVVENSKICELGLGDELGIPEGAKIIDVAGKYLVPGFIDIHMHGGGGADTMDATSGAIEKISATHAKGGTTSLLLTTITASPDEIIKTVKVIGAAKRKTLPGAEVLGAHLEGPYLSLEQRGAQNPQFVRNPSPDEYGRILKFSEDILRMSIAPELEGALDLGKVLVQKGIIACIGHSNANYSQVLSAVEAGFTHVTHLFSGMSTIRRIDAFRVTGVVEATLLLDELTTELIADGCHIPPELMKLAIKTKGLDRLCVITDAVSATGMPPGRYEIGGIEYIVEDGVAKLPDRSGFAGSVATMDRCVRNVVKLVGLSIQDAVKMATLNPAKIIGVDREKGVLAKGRSADIVIFDEDINILMTIVRGRIVYDRLSRKSFQPNDYSPC